MKLATLLIIVLSHQGYWLGGQPGTIVLRPAVEGGLPDADLLWDVHLDGVQLESGKVTLHRKDNQAAITLTLPNPRLATTLHWRYRIMAAGQQNPVDAGDVVIHLFPNDLTEGLARRVGDKRLVVWDKPDGLPKILDQAKVPYTRVADGGKLQFVEADVVLVGQDMIDASPFSQGPLLNLAESGSSILIMRQSSPQRLMGYLIARRNVPAKFDWRIDHPLLAGLDPADLKSWFAGVMASQAIQLPVDEPALEIGSYPREVPGNQPAPIDAILVSKSIGKGRTVLCQIPLGSWTDDPRSQIFLNNAIDYLLTRPQPTPRPSERPTPRPVEQRQVSTIDISPGDKP